MNLKYQMKNFRIKSSKEFEYSCNMWNYCFGIDWWLCEASNARTYFMNTCYFIVVLPLLRFGFQWPKVTWVGIYDINYM